MMNRDFTPSFRWMLRGQKKMQITVTHEIIQNPRSLALSRPEPYFPVPECARDARLGIPPLDFGVYAVLSGWLWNEDGGFSLLIPAVP